MTDVDATRVFDVDIKRQARELGIAINEADDWGQPIRVRKGKVTVVQAVTSTIPATVTVQIEQKYSAKMMYIGLPPVVNDEVLVIKYGSGQRVCIVTSYDKRWHQVGDAGEPAFTNAWVATGGQAMRFRRSGNWVELDGRIATGATGTSAFTLPAGSRPVSDRFLPVTVFGGVGYVNVSAAGLVIPNTLTGNASTETHLTQRFPVD